MSLIKNEDSFDLRGVEKKDVTLYCTELQRRFWEHFWLHVSGIPGIQQDAPTPSGWAWMKVVTEVTGGHLFRRWDQSHPWSEGHWTPGIPGAGGASAWLKHAHTAMRGGSLRLASSTCFMSPSQNHIGLNEDLSRSDSEPLRVPFERLLIQQRRRQTGSKVKHVCLYSTLKRTTVHQNWDLVMKSVAQLQDILFSWSTNFWILPG